jgi:hypothetical protein
MGQDPVVFQIRLAARVEFEYRFANPGSALAGLIDSLESAAKTPEQDLRPGVFEPF